MAMNWPTFFTRLGSAIVFTIIMLLGLLYPHPYAIIFLSLMIQFLCVKEWHHLLNRILVKKGAREISTIYHWIAQSMALLTMVSVWTESKESMWLILFLLVLIAIVSVFYHERTGWGILSVFTSLLYIALPVSLLLMLKMLSPVLPLIIILLIWTNDTMAYMTGSFIGKTSFSKISPKKTWEGIIGGVVFTMILAFCAIYFSWFDKWLGDSMPNSPIYWMVIALMVAIASIIGDLLESKMKRMAEVKDSGNIMPGHGGALDRFDSMLLVLPTILITLFFLNFFL